MLPSLAATVPGRIPATKTPSVPSSSSPLSAAAAGRPISCRPSCVLPDSIAPPTSSRVRTTSPGSARPYSDSKSSTSHTGYLVIGSSHRPGQVCIVVFPVKKYDTWRDYSDLTWSSGQASIGRVKPILAWPDGQSRSELSGHVSYFLTGTHYKLWVEMGERRCGLSWLTIRAQTKERQKRLSTPHAAMEIRKLLVNLMWKRGHAYQHAEIAEHCLGVGVVSSTTKSLFRQKWKTHYGTSIGWVSV